MPHNYQYILEAYQNGETLKQACKPYLENPYKVRAWMAHNPNYKVNKRQRLFHIHHYFKANRERTYQNHYTWVQKHPNEISKYRHDCHVKNKGHDNQRNRKYYQLHRQHLIEQHHKYYLKYHKHYQKLTKRYDKKNKRYNRIKSRIYYRRKHHVTKFYHHHNK